MSLPTLPVRLLGVLPFLMLIGLASIVKQRGWAGSIRESLVVAGVNTAVWALAGAELLGFFHALGFWPLLIWWGLPVALLTWCCWRGPKLTLPERTRDPVLLSVVGAIALLLALTFLSGVLAVPSNGDALVYHLPRQVYWMQQQHVGFFSGNARMLTMPPLAEYIGVQSMILAGGDHWVHSIQWVAYALGAAAVSMIARDLGLNARYQALTALLLVAIPPAALQASNAKNDLVTAFFFCALSCFALQVVLREKLSGVLAWHLGACGGLLLLAKGTGMVFGFPLAIWIVCALLAKHGWRQSFRTAAMATTIAALLSGPFLFRTYISSESPLKQNKGNFHAALSNKTFAPQAFISNVLRNTAMHIATDSWRIDPLFTGAMTALHRGIGIDLNDPRTTYGQSPPYRTELALTREDLAKAPVHVLLGIVAFFPLATRLIRRRDKRERLVASFLLLPFLAFFTFCFLLSWQVWHSRLHIPLLCMLCPSIVFALGPRFPRVLLAAGAVAAALAFYAVACNASKPLVGKSSIITHPAMRSMMHPADGVQAAKTVAAICRSLRPKVAGLEIQPNHAEYTLLRTLLSELDRAPQFLKLNVGWRKPGPIPEPDLIVSWYIPQEKSKIDVTNYSLILSTNSVRVYVPRKS